MKRTGDTVVINGKTYTLEEKLGGGTEGAVFDISEMPSYVIKLLNTSRMNDNENQEVKNRLKWLKDVIGNSELKHKLSVPKALADGDLGYIMVKASEHQKLDVYLAYPRNEQDFLQWLKDEYRLKKRFQIISFMFNALEKIHIHGLIFTDLSPNNIMVHNAKNNLVFIDTDNMRKRDDPYTGALGTDGYMAPEIYHFIDSKLTAKLKDRNIKIDADIISSAGKLSVDSDVFSAAIIAFQILTLQHPFVGDKAENGTAEEETEARHCKTDYILDKNCLNPCSTNPFIGLFAKNVTATHDISELFNKTFVTGKTQPRLRPTALEFYHAFDKALDQMLKCPHCGVDILYHAEIENICWYCNTPIPEQISLRIFDIYEENNRYSLISNLTNNNHDAEIITGDNRFELSNIVFTANERRYLHLRHFERNNSNNDALFALTISDEFNKILRIEINTKVDTPITANSLLINKQSNSIVPIDKAKEFPANEYNICFEIINSRVGKIRTIGRFYKGMKEW